MTLQGQKGGVTQVQWSPDGNYLYTGGRRDGEILCWDVRHSSDVVYRCTRASEGTNQRIGQAPTIHSFTRSLAHSLSTEQALARLWYIYKYTWWLVYTGVPREVARGGGAPFLQNVTNEGANSAAAETEPNKVSGPIDVSLASGLTLSRVVDTW